jgi:predicted  nucleic acid-binding Zn-ribbon protein
MATPAQILKDIHRLKRHIKDLDAKLEKGPKAHKAHQLKVTQAEEALHKAQDGIKQLKVKIHEKEVSVKAAQQGIEKLEKTPISNKKEYDALRLEIATAQKGIHKLEDEILETMGELEDKTKAIPEWEKTLQKAKAESVHFEKDHQQRLDKWSAERQSSLTELSGVEGQLPEDLRIIYDRLTGSKWADAISAVHERICATCYTEVTPQMYNELQRGLFVICKSCGRMLYAEQPTRAETEA